MEGIPPGEGLPALSKDKSPKWATPVKPLSVSLKPRIQEPRDQRIDPVGSMQGSRESLWRTPSSCWDSGTSHISNWAYSPNEGQPNVTIEVKQEKYWPIWDVILVHFERHNLCQQGQNMNECCQCCKGQGRRVPQEASQSLSQSFPGSVCAVFSLIASL